MPTYKTQELPSTHTASLSLVMQVCEFANYRYIYCSIPAMHQEVSGTEHSDCS